MTEGPLLLDLGNTRLRVADWEGPGRYGLVDELTLESQENSDIQSSLASRITSSGRDIFVSSTNPSFWEDVLSSFLSGATVHLVDLDSLPCRVHSKGTGMDRLLAGHAAWRRCETSVLVADVGTAWTLDALGGGGEFLGGAIGPGLFIQERALAKACPHLGNSVRGDIEEEIPRETAVSLHAGTHLAMACALEGLADRWEGIIGPFSNRFLSGGGAESIRKYLSKEWICEQYLVLEGLAWLPRS